MTTLNNWGNDRTIMVILPSGYRIRTAREEDLEQLAEIERAASVVFQETSYSFLVEAEPLPLDFVQQQFHKGRVWVAVDEHGHPVGFAIARDVDGTAYLQELDVLPAHHGQGIGRGLVETVCTWARQHRYHKVSLSTFREIPWNAPFYAKLGFHVVEESDLAHGFQLLRQEEAEAGLPIGDRVIMQRDL